MIVEPLAPNENQLDINFNWFGLYVRTGRLKGFGWFWIVTWPVASIFLIPSQARGSETTSSALRTRKPPDAFITDPAFIIMKFVRDSPPLSKRVSTEPKRFW